MNYQSVWVPGDLRLGWLHDLRWVVNPNIQTGLIFASFDWRVASESPSLKIQNRSWNCHTRSAQNNHFQKSIFFPKKWHNDVIWCHFDVMLFNLLAKKLVFISSENRINGYSLKWYKNNNKCYRGQWVNCNHGYKLLEKQSVQLVPSFKQFCPTIGLLSN